MDTDRTMVWIGFWVAIVFISLIWAIAWNSVRQAELMADSGYRASTTYVKDWRGNE